MTPSIAPLKRILVPVDFSPRSANALEFAVALGSAHGSEIDVLHVWHSDLATGVTVARERAKSALRDFVTGLELQGNVTLRRRTDHGDPYLTIQRLAQLSGFDLLVVAGPEANRFDADTVSRRLLGSAPSPVLFVPPHRRTRVRSDRDRSLSVERVLVPLALAGEDLQALDWAESLARADGALVEVLLSADTSDEQRARLRARPALPRTQEYEDPADSLQAVRQRVAAFSTDLLIFSGKRGQLGTGDPRAEHMALGQPCASWCVP